MALRGQGLRKLVEIMEPKDWSLRGQMNALNEIRKEMSRVHLVIEVRDARIPFSSANLDLQRLFKRRAHMVVFTKADLADPVMIQEWKTYYGENYYFVNGLGKASVYRLAKVVKQRLRSLGDPLEKIKVAMLVGLPSVGKTTLANTMLRLGRWNVSELEQFNLGQTDMEPYTTKCTSDMKINYEPPMYVMDTPPVMIERLTDLETGMKLALTGAMDDGIVGHVSLAGLMIAMLNQYPKALHSKWKAQYLAHKFISKTRDINDKTERRLMGSDDHAADVRGIISDKFLQFEGDVNDVEQLRKLVSDQFKAVREHYLSVAVHGKQAPNLRVARRLLSLYRVGKLGCHTLDELPSKNPVKRK